jgi:anti-sigma factor ChrR (cupin superfamily)
MSGSKQAKGPVQREQDQAALAALEFLTPSERAQALRELVAGLKEAAALMASVVPPVPPAPSLRERLLRRIANFEKLKPLADVRRDEGSWAPYGVPGVDVKVLYQDTATATVLVRMAPGTTFPAHLHHDDEQCLVLSGDIGWGDIVYREGDFVVMGRKTVDPKIGIEHSNLLLIVAGRNEFVETRS